MNLAFDCLNKFITDSQSVLPINYLLHYPTFLTVCIGGGWWVPVYW